MLKVCLCGPSEAFLSVDFQNLKSMLLNQGRAHVYPAAYDMKGHAAKRPLPFKKILLAEGNISSELKTKIPSPTKKRRVT